MLGARSQVMDAERVVEKVDDLKKKFNDLQDSLTSQLVQLLVVIKMPHKPMREEHNVDAHREGESNHHIHFFGDHQSSSHRTPKLDMYKFDDSNPAIWVQQMEQCFLLNNI